MTTSSWHDNRITHLNGWTLQELQKTSINYGLDPLCAVSTSEDFLRGFILGVEHETDQRAQENKG